MMTCIIDHCIDLIREQINGLQYLFYMDDDGSNAAESKQ